MLLQGEQLIDFANGFLLGMIIQNNYNNAVNANESFDSGRSLFSNTSSQSYGYSTNTYELSRHLVRYEVLRNKNFMML